MMSPWLPLIQKPQNLFTRARAWLGARVGVRELIEMPDCGYVPLRRCAAYPIHARRLINRATLSIEKHAPEVILRVGVAALGSATIPVTTSGGVKRPSFLAKGKVATDIPLGLNGPKLGCSDKKPTALLIIRHTEKSVGTPLSETTKRFGVLLGGSFLKPYMRHSCLTFEAIKVEVAKEILRLCYT
jgi:hypothetical protein